MNILIKLTCLIGLVIAPILGELAGSDHNDHSGAVIEEFNGKGANQPSGSTFEAIDLINASE